MHVLALSNVAQKLTSERIQQAQISVALQESAISLKVALDRLKKYGSLGDSVRHTVMQSNLLLETLFFIIKDPIKRTELIDLFVLSAAVDGHIPTMQFLIEHSVDPNRTLRHGLDTTLHKAAKYGQLEMIKFLLAHDTNVNNVNAVGDSNHTPLHYAVREGHSEVVKFLLERGANLHALNNYNATALMTARNSSSLLNEHVRSRVIQMLTEAVVQQTTQADSEQQAQEHDFIVQASVGNIDTLQRMLTEKLVDINAQDGDGNTALMVAARVGRTDVVEFLLAHGARTDIRNGLNQDAHALALSTGQLDTVMLLIKHNLGTTI